MRIDYSDKTVGGFTYEFVRGLSTQDPGAAEYGECMETARRIRRNDLESWTREWTRTADRVAAYADRRRQEGDVIAARGAYLRAANYYRMAVFYVIHTDPRHTALWQRSEDAFHRVVELSEDRIEIVEIDFDGAVLPGYFISGGEGPRPTLIALGGFDSTKEEVYSWIGAAAAEHGWNCLIFEGPGQWGALKRNPGLLFRPDYEKPVGAAIDYLETRPDVDADRLAIIGYSMGGYLAPRGALDPRIKACVPNSLVVDCGASARAGMEGLVKSQKLMEFSFRIARKLLVPVQWGFQHSQWTLGIDSAQDWIDVYEPYTLVGLEGRYRHPMLFLFGEDDIHDAAAPSAEIIRGLLDFILSLDCPRSVRLFTAEEGASSHCQMGGLSYARGTVFSWLDHVLLGGRERTSADPRAGDRFVEAFGRYGGPEAAARATEVLRVATLY